MDWIDRIGGVRGACRIAKRGCGMSMVVDNR